jgi:hypothetical protein
VRDQASAKDMEKKYGRKDLTSTPYIDYKMRTNLPHFLNQVRMGKGWQESKQFTRERRRNKKAHYFTFSITP